MFSSSLSLRISEQIEKICDIGKRFYFQKHSSSVVASVYRWADEQKININIWTKAIEAKAKWNCMVFFPSSVCFSADALLDGIVFVNVAFCASQILRLSLFLHLYPHVFFHLFLHPHLHPNFHSHYSFLYFGIVIVYRSILHTDASNFQHLTQIQFADPLIYSLVCVYMPCNHNTVAAKHIQREREAERGLERDKER